MNVTGNAIFVKSFPIISFKSETNLMLSLGSLNAGNYSLLSSIVIIMSLNASLLIRFLYLIGYGILSDSKT